MNIESFTEFCRRHPFILYPVVLFQTELRAAVNDLKFWDQLTHYRLDLCNNKYIPFEVFFEDLINGKLDPDHRKTTLRGKGSAILAKKTTHRLNHKNNNSHQHPQNDNNENNKNNNTENQNSSSTNSPEKPFNKYYYFYLYFIDKYNCYRFFSFFLRKSQTNSKSPPSSTLISPESSSSSSPTLLPSEMIRENKKKSPHKIKEEKKNHQKTVQFSSRNEIQK